MTFKTLAYIEIYALEKENKNKIAGLSGSVSLKYDENWEPELWIEANRAIVNYFLSKGYLTKQESEEILKRADTIVLY